jgi:hypothetical protein
MKKSINQREFDKAKEIAKEYQNKGFKVTIEPKFSNLPREIQCLGFQPDIIATSENINLIIEVKTFETIKNSKLAEIAEKVKSIEGWDFELVYTNPRSKNEAPSVSVPNTYMDAKRSVDRAARFLGTDAGEEYSDAALLLIWGAVENALRANFSTYKNTKKNLTPRALIRDAVILGIIGKNDQIFLESMMKKRNEISHGIFNETLNKRELEKLVNLGQDIVRQIA